MGLPKITFFFVLSTSYQFLYNIDKICTESTSVFKTPPNRKTQKKVTAREKEVIKFAPLLPLNHNPSADFHCCSLVRLIHSFSGYYVVNLSKEWF